MGSVLRSMSLKKKHEINKYDQQTKSIQSNCNVKLHSENKQSMNQF